MDEIRRVVDPWGREVVFDFESWLHLADGVRPWLLDHVDAILAAVVLPHRWGDDPASSRERFDARHPLLRTHWLRVIVDYTEGSRAGGHSVRRVRRSSEEREMSITFDNIEFARSHYDPRGDVLYLTVSGYQGPPWDAHCGDEGHNVEFDESGRVIAMTIVGARWWLARDGALNITLPAADLTPQELAALGGSTALSATEAELAPALKSAA